MVKQPVYMLHMARAYGDAFQYVLPLFEQNVISHSMYDQVYNVCHIMETNLIKLYGVRNTLKTLFNSTVKKIPVIREPIDPRQHIKLSQR